MMIMPSHRRIRSEIGPESSWQIPENEEGDERDPGREAAYGPGDDTPEAAHTARPIKRRMAQMGGYDHRGCFSRQNGHRFYSSSYSSKLDDGLN
jgi:hypothetical protein